VGLMEKERVDKEEANKEKIALLVKKFAEKGLLLSPDALEALAVEELSKEKSLETTAHTDESKESSMLVVTKDALKFAEKEKEINWVEFEKAKTLQERKKDDRIYQKFVEYLSSEEKGAELSGEKKVPDSVQIIECYEEISKERSVQDFVDFFNARYKVLEQMLRNRQELENLMTISRAEKKRERETVSVIGLVFSKEKRKNGNIMLTLEDQTDIIKIFFNKNKKELFEMAEQIVLDEVIGVCGTAGDNIIFANSMVRPDIPATIEKKSSPEDGYAIFLSDLHVGSKNFLEEEFNKFLRWINAEAGNESQKAIAEKIKYVFIAGDLIDGVGIYADQDEDLVTKDVYEQYSECARLLSKIPQRIKIIMCAGNHDAMRIAEPQPTLYKDFAAELWKLPNVVMVSNPAVVNIGASENFSGFNVLMYHGYSFDYYASDVDMIRMKGGYDRADLIMKFLLQRRHLAPAQSSTLFIPDPHRDPLIITRIPDIFLTGHIHKCTVAQYKNIILISGSCWQSKTAFQIRMGHHPQPARVPIMNLKTREVKILNFEK